MFSLHTQRPARQRTLLEIPASWACLACVSRVRRCHVLGIVRLVYERACMKRRSGCGRCCQCTPEVAAGTVCTWRNICCPSPAKHQHLHVGICRGTSLWHFHGGPGGGFTRVILRRPPQSSTPLQPISIALQSQCLCGVD
jgi:hypothetical protein